MNMKKLILLMHIDENTADSLDFLLSSMGFDIIKVSKAPTVADILKTGRKPDLIITDVRMEESQLNGVMSIIDQSHVPVIVFSEERLCSINAKLQKLKGLDIIESFDDNIPESIGRIVSMRLKAKKRNHALH